MASGSKLLVEDSNFSENGEFDVAHDASDEYGMVGALGVWAPVEAYPPRVVAVAVESISLRQSRYLGSKRELIVLQGRFV